LPDPDAPEAIVIQPAFSVAVQLHPLVVVTVMVPVPPAAGKDWLAGEMAKTQVIAVCVTVKVCPAIVSVPLRNTPGFAVTVKLTVPLPVPEAPDAMLIQLTLATAVHEQALPPVVTAVEPDPPLAATVWVAGAIAKLHEVSCVIVNVCPAIVSVPLRAEPGLAATVMLTVPLPVPEPPDVTVIQLTFGTAVHAQPAPAVTALEPDQPLAGTVWPVGAIVKVHDVLCVTVNVCPAIVSVPVRAAPELAATVKLTVPLPVPEPPDVTVIQLTFATAVHAQPVPAVTALEPDPPLAATV
jgi:hypothetical protein